MSHRRRVVVALALTLLTGTWSFEPSLAGAEAPDRLVLEGGDVIVNFRQMAPSDCPLDYVCLWEHADFFGSMVMYRDCCNWNNLADLGFNNRASSWRNRKGVDAKVADFSDGNGDRLCLNNGAQSGNMGAWNDKATSIKIFSSSGAC